MTRDRVLHNRAITQGFNSYILDEDGNLTGKPLKGIKLRKLQPQSVRKDLLTNYMQIAPDEVRLLTSCLTSNFTLKHIENLRTKRRRIRSYFGDVANIDSIDFTIASEKISKAVIGGYVLKINARQSLKALMNASEGYCSDQNSCHILSPVFYALSNSYCLHLSQVPITLYITSKAALELCQKIKANETITEVPIEQGVRILLNNLKKVELMPCVKGPFFERMQNKIKQLKLRKTKELVSVDIQALALSLPQNINVN